MRVRPLGDGAIVVETGGDAGAVTMRRVHALWALFSAEHLEGVTDIVPGLASVTLHYEPAGIACAAGELPHQALARTVEARIAGLHVPDELPTRIVTIPVCYDPTVAPDLDDVARHAGLSTSEVVALHSAGDYIVHMIGFLPGFPYLAGLDPRLTMHRRATPRLKVPAGSVAVGGSHTCIYPLESPGGWQIIGRSSVRLFSPTREPATMLQLGDHVRFRQVSLVELESSGSE